MHARRSHEQDQYSEDALALAFAEHFANELRFVQATSPYKWFVYIEGEWSGIGPGNL